MARKLEYKWLVGIVYVLALFMDLMDMTITNVAVPTLTTKFATTTTTIEWVITGYLLSLALFIPISGWMGDRFGTKRVFIAALAIFVSGSVLCGLAWSVESLIAFRVVQGVGGGMLTPVGMTMLFRAFPPSERAAASAVLAIPAMVAPAAGPLLGGWIVQYQDWRWIFFLNVAPGLLALFASISFLKEEMQANPGKLDVRGFVLAGAGLVAVVYALSEVGRLGFGDPEVIGFGLAGLAILGLFTLVELHTDEPMLDVRLLTDKLFGASNFVLLVGNASIMGTFFLLPIFLQTQKGVSAFNVGLVTFPIALGVALMAQPAAKLYAIVGPRRMMIVGFTGNMAMTAALGLINYGTADWLIGANMFIRGLFLAFLFIPLQAATFATISPEDTGRASSIFSVTRQIAASFGVAILATALTSRLSFHHAVMADPATRDAALAAFQDTFFFAGAVSVLGIVACFLIDDAKAAEAAGMDFAGEGPPPFVLEPANEWDAA